MYTFFLIEIVLIGAYFIFIEQLPAQYKSYVVHVDVVNNFFRCFFRLQFAVLIIKLKVFICYNIFLGMCLKSHLNRVIRAPFVYFASLIYTFRFLSSFSFWVC